MKNLKDTIMESRMKVGGTGANPKYNITDLTEEQYEIIYNLIKMAVNDQLDVPELDIPAVRENLNELWETISNE